MTVREQIRPVKRRCPACGKGLTDDAGGTFCSRACQHRVWVSKGLCDCATCMELLFLRLILRLLLYAKLQVLREDKF